MKRTRLKTLLHKYLNRKASSEERFLVDSWYDSFDKDPDQSDSLKDPKTLGNFKAMIISRTFQKEFTKKLYFRNIKRIAIAASVILTLTFTVIFYQNHLTGILTEENKITFQTIQTKIGETKEVTLSDGTIITLTANSKIKIQSDFGKKGRKIALDGEAFFLVVRDTLSPFVIATPSLSIEVLGTSFNLKSRKEIEREILQVFTGKVQVEAEDKILGVFEKSLQLIYDKKTNRSFVSKLQEQEWKTGSITLNNASFKELANEFYNIYGVSLASTNKEVLTKKYHIKLRSSKSIHESVNVLCEIISKNYRKEGNQIIIY